MDQLVVSLGGSISISSVLKACQTQIGIRSESVLRHRSGLSWGVHKQLKGITFLSFFVSTVCMILSGHTLLVLQPETITGIVLKLGEGKERKTGLGLSSKWRARVLFLRILSCIFLLPATFAVPVELSQAYAMEKKEKGKIQVIYFTHFEL